MLGKLVMEVIPVKDTKEKMYWIKKHKAESVGDRAVLIDYRSKVYGVSEDRRRDL